MQQGKLTKTIQDKIARLKRYGAEPDHELLMWEDWIKIRKEEVSEISKRNMRNPVDLTMNLLEKVREDKERKTVLEHAQIEKKAAARGALWERPDRLVTKCVCGLKSKCDCEPPYEVHRTPAELGRPRIIHHVGVPASLQVEEKCLLGKIKRKPCELLDADYKKYREKREEELKEKILKIDPFR